MKAIKVDAETLGLQDSFYYKEFIKQELTGAKWVKDKKIWQIEFSIGNIEKLLKVNCEIPDDVKAEYKKRKKVMDQVTAEKLSEKTKAIESMPIKATPYEHQVKAYNIACKIMNLFKEGDK